jgi:hypothetical protein
MADKLWRSVAANCHMGSSTPRDTRCPAGLPVFDGNAVGQQGGIRSSEHQRKHWQLERQRYDRKLSKSQPKTFLE